MLHELLVRMFFCAVLCAVSTLSMAQQTETFDGNWLKQNVDAFNRVNVTRNFSDSDVQDSLVLVSYVSGMIAVHRQNNLRATLMFAASSGKPPKSDDVRLKTAFAFTPLLAIPDNLTPQQIVAILQKYLESHPEKWEQNAPLLITNALKDAFSKK